jgi:hypothetical protein
MNIEQLREAIAHCDRTIGKGTPNFSDFREVIEAAKAYLSLLESKTHKIVPIEPTKNMVNQGRLGTVPKFNAWHFKNVYKAMIQAAPDFIEEK